MLTTRSYWAEGIPLDLVKRSLAGSLCFGLYEGRSQVGLARVITDPATFAYLCDVATRLHPSEPTGGIYGDRPPRPLSQLVRGATSIPNR